MDGVSAFSMIDVCVSGGGGRCGEVVGLCGEGLCGGGPVFSIIDVCIELTDASGSDSCCGGAVVSGGEGLCGGGPGCLRLYYMIDSRIFSPGINLGPLRQHCSGLVGSCITFSCV